MITKCLLNNNKPVCKLLNSKVTIYEFEKSTILLNNESNMNMSGICVEAIKPFIEKARNVIILSFYSQSQYRGNSVRRSDETFIKALNSRFESIANLEEPNFISGLGAGVATWRLFSNLSFEIYTIHLCSPILDASTVQPILKLLENLNLPVDQNYSYSHINDNSLYI